MPFPEDASRDLLDYTVHISRIVMANVILPFASLILGPIKETSNHLQKASANIWDHSQIKFNILLVSWKDVTMYHEIDTSKINVSIIIAMYRVPNHLCELRWILPAEVKSTLELENVLASFQHPSTSVVMKAYQDCLDQRGLTKS